jgi:hypothetical protein
MPEDKRTKVLSQERKWKGNKHVYDPTVYINKNK